MGKKKTTIDDLAAMGKRGIQMMAKRDDVERNVKDMLAIK